MSLNYTKVSDLSPLSDLTGLRALSLAQTKVSDISPLRRLTHLRHLSIYRTDVSNLEPITGLHDLQTLTLSRTNVRDLRPIQMPSRLVASGRESQLTDLRFNDIPAIEQDGELFRLSKIDNRQERIRETLAYLKTLPPWPEPYTPATRGDASVPAPIGLTENK